MALTVLQVLPALEAGGVERGTVEVARALVAAGHRALVMSAGGRLTAPLEACGATHLPWPLGRKRPGTLAYVWRLRRFLEQGRIDIVHARSRLPAWVAWLAVQGLAPGRRPHFLTTVHGPYTVNRYSAIMTRGERVIAISRMIRHYVLANYPGVEPWRVEVIHRGVDPAEFPHGYRPPPAWLERWRQEMPQLQGRRVVTLPARITRWKGQEDFLALLARLRARGLPVHGLLVGGAEPRREPFLRELERQAAVMDLGELLSFTGHRGDIREIMAVSDVVLSLSREPEAFGRTTLEALSLGVPVVGYDHGGVAEVLAEVFPTGRVPPGDIEAAAGRVAELLEARPVVPVTGAFTLERMLGATLALYERVAGSPAGG